MTRSQKLEGVGECMCVFFKEKKYFNFQGFHLEMTENALCPKAQATRSMSSLRRLHFSISSAAATRALPEKNLVKCQETSQSGDCQKNSLLMKAAHRKL